MTIKAEILLDSLYNFTQDQKITLERVAKELNDLKDRKIGLDTLNNLTNAYKELDAMRENLILRLISSMKRGDKVN